MDSILLLYDTDEKDLARDLCDLLKELDIEVKLIPRLPDLGKTLQEKEERYFNEADALVFLITPGSTRKGNEYPSPSVSDEMGQARQKFKANPEKVIYLVDKTCNVQAIDQKTYIIFDRTDIRSVLEAVTMLLKNLKASGILGRKKLEKRETPGIDIVQVVKSTEPRLKQICMDLSDRPNGMITVRDFDKLLKDKYYLRDRDVNFVKRDIQLKGLISYVPPKQPFPLLAYWTLSNVGWELVRYELKSRPQEPTLHQILATLAVRKQSGKQE